MSTDPALVKSIFLELVATPEPAARAARLEERCGHDPVLKARVKTLLAANARAEENEGTASYPPEFGDGTADFSRKDEQVGAVLAGKYKLIEEIGEGGMGSVYMAQQTEPVKRTVAVKVIKAGMDSRAVLARFEAERQALAMMDHTNISRVLAAGTTSTGRHFFVMELVKGIPITDYCDQQKLTPRQRLELFVPVCNAVQHAHQKGIIHRDIKPSNVLVALYDDRPVPKVIDFGVAKAAGQSLTDKTLMTGFGAVVGTPEYMSPEQANLNNLDVDTRSDVYSLGVLLYELLTGTTPIDRARLGHAALLEILRIVREVEAPMPSAKLSTSDSLPSVAANRGTDPSKLSNLMRGELDWVLLKALEKDRTRRYDSANGLARDIQRYLADEVVEARPPTTSYRFRKFVTRHKGQVVAATLVLAALLAGIIGTTLGLFEARRQEQIALTEAKKQQAARQQTREVLDTLTSEALEGWFTRERFLTPEQKDLLRRLLDQYSVFAEEEGESTDARRGQALALMRIGNIQQALGERAAAGQSFTRASALVGTAANPISDNLQGLKLVSDVRTTLFKFYLEGRLFREAEQQEREAQAARLRALAIDPTQQLFRFTLAGGHMNLAATLGDQNRLDEADTEHRAAIAELEQLVQQFPDEKRYRANLAIELNNRAIFARKQSRLADALGYNGRAIALRRQRLGEIPDQPIAVEDLVKALDVRGNLFNLMDRPVEAEAAFRESISQVIRLTEALPSIPRYRVMLAGDHEGLAQALLLQGRNQLAAKEARQAVALASSVAKEFPEDLPPGRALITSLTQASKAELANQAHTEAESAARRALAEIDRLTRAFGKRTDLLSDRFEAIRVLGNVLHLQARFSEQEPVQRELVNILDELGRVDTERNIWRAITIARVELAGALLRRRDLAAAEAELRAASANLERVPATEREQMRSIYYFEMAKLTVDAGRWAEAQDWAGRAIESFTKREEKNPGFAENRDFLVQCHWHRAMASDRLMQYARAAADWARAAEKANIPMDKAFYRAHRGNSLSKAGEAAAAAAEFADAVAQAENSLNLPRPVGITYYDAAAVFALASGGSKDPKLVEKYGAEAVRLLGQAAEAGFLNDPAQVQTFRNAAEYIALHSREDYRKLLAKLPDKPPPIPKTSISPPKQ
ncbi:hypothetical protein BH10PLA2_BH10PLA2_22930 [soil metagenome]